MYKFHFTLFCTGQGLVMAEMSHAVMSIDLKERKILAMMFTVITNGAALGLMSEKKQFMDIT